MQTRLGHMNLLGQSVQQDHAQAADWYEKVAEQGHASAQYSLGVSYDDVEGVPEDDGREVDWYRKAAEQGHAGAQSNLGVMYANGDGVPQDNNQAIA